MNKLLLGASEVFSRLLARVGDSYECYCCHKRIGRFLPYRGGRKNIPLDVIALDVIGSDVENFSCPYCRSHDRERHLLMYFDRMMLWERFINSAILHFAPERNLSERIRNSRPNKYIMADLLPTSIRIAREDIAHLSFGDGTFDVVIANHVLEHVRDDSTAMTEVFRVLKPGGIAILQTPFSAVLEATSEDRTIVSAADRLGAYGQEDHVRLYGKDLFSKLEAGGLHSLVRTHDQVLGDLDASRYGVNRREPFFLFQRPVANASVG